MTYHIPMCVICGQREVQIVVNSTGAGYCSGECESSYSAVLPYGHDLDGYEYPEFDG
jgi:hypothetical protein